MKVQTEIENMDGTTTVLEHEDNDIAREFIARMVEQRQRAKHLLDAGVPALGRLMTIAEANASGQATYVSKFLLGIYNGPRFPFSLNDFRRLDDSILADCWAVLEMDIKASHKEVHDYFDNGGERFESMAVRYEVPE